MNDVQVAKECYVPKENVKLYLGYSTNAVKEEVRKLRKEGKIYDYTGGKRIATVIYLKSNEAILTNTTVETINKRMNQA